MFAQKVCLSRERERERDEVFPFNGDQKVFKYLAKFDFESICLLSEELEHTNTTIWTGKHEPISTPFSPI